jgi:hypothetical protein
VKARNQLALPGRMSPLAFVANDRSPPLETPDPRRPMTGMGDEEPFKVRKRDGDGGLRGAPQGRTKRWAGSSRMS